MRAEPVAVQGLPAPGRCTVDPATIGTGDVLVLRALGLGDSLTAVAPLRGVRRMLPDHRIVLAAPEPVGSWLTELGVVDGVLPQSGLVPLPRVRGGHVAVNLHGRGPRSHELLLASGPERLVGFAAPEAGHTGPAWRRDEHEVHRWCRLVSEAGGPCGPEDLLLRPHRPAPAGAPVLIHPGAASGSRRWPAPRWREVARALVADGHRVVVTGSPAESGLAAAVVDGVDGAEDRCGTLDLAGLAAAVGESAAVLSTDTGVAHVATALAVPSVVLFGPTPPAWWGPAVDPGLHTVLWHGDPSAPAWGDPHAAELDERLAAVTPDEVLAAARSQLAAART
ncbi:glycosyltransferase family 9 protein [Kocuria sp. CNJ-770]|uniref:glycosyltransferase family 9 protein n=1 Tax=Kocuria sp. CNJ-770 TaxID=1904964 RepID=UPI0021008A70|nr:glycosyltransferase family 9 protein [Kocuria sp. CNJ-770]